MTRHISKTELLYKKSKPIDHLSLGKGIALMVKEQKDAAYHTHQMAISLDWLIEKYTDRDHTIVANDRMWKSKKSAYFVDRNFGFEPKCMN